MSSGKDSGVPGISWQLTKVIIAVLLIMVGGGYLLPRMLEVTSLDAVVNAKLVMVHAPIEGVLTQSPPPTGTVVRRGTILARIENPSLNRSQLQLLQVDIATMEERVLALQRQLKDLAGLQARFQQQVDDHRTSLVGRVKQRVEDSTFHADLAKEEESRAKLEWQEIEDLEKRGVALRSEQRARKYNWLAAQHKSTQAQQLLTQAKAEYEKAQKGDYVDESSGGPPYAQQRVDELTISATRIHAELSEAERRLEAAEISAKVEQERLELQSSQDVPAPSAGIVWRRYSHPGGKVGTGSELAQLQIFDEVFIDASVHRNDMRYVELGKSVAIRPIGSGTVLTGKVQAVMSQAALRQNLYFAVDGPNVNEDAQRVIIALDSSGEQAADLLARSLTVGQRALVSFGNRANWLDAVWTMAR